MQLCKCINCFLKAHNKQLNKYCLNFIIFLPPKKKFIKKWFGFGSGWVDPQKTQIGSRVNPFLLRVKKNRIQVESYQKILTRFAISIKRGFVGVIITILVLSKRDKEVAPSNHYGHHHEGLLNRIASMPTIQESLCGSR